MYSELNLFDDDDLEIFLNKYNEIPFSTYTKLSIFSNKWEKKECYDYHYIQPNDDEELYYINIYHQIFPIFINKKKQIFINSFQLFQNIHHIVKNIKHILSIVKSINLEDTSNIVHIDKNVIVTQKFNTLYGHFKDEIFCLHDFITKFNNSNYYPLIEYNPNNNYNEISNLLFNNDYINPYLFGKKIIKFKSALFIEHHYNLKTFHSFPIYTRNFIIRKIKDEYLCNNKNIFLTRSKNTHTNRLINNFSEITNIFEKNNFKIINPEDISLLDFIKQILLSQNVITTWGSALVNLIYLNMNTNVYILKSNSYKDENINIFRNLINNYKLNINIITCDDENNIDISEIQKIINNT
jgi:capsular polysaccharide biosynthesis protein